MKMVYLQKRNDPIPHDMCINIELITSVLFIGDDIRFFFDASENFISISKEDWEYIEEEIRLLRGFSSSVMKDSGC